MRQRKIMFIILSIFIVLLIIYVTLWVVSNKKYSVEYGISFNQIYAAESLELDWQETYTAMLEELKPEYIRIAAMWSQIEEVDGVLDFSQVDWMMDRAAENDTKVTLVVGQKAPRWPECHVPEWSHELSDEDYKKRLLNCVGEVVARYKDHPALELWQVENEPFIKFRFGECAGFQEDATYDEIELVKKMDPNHKIIITDSGELSTWWKASRAGDLFGTTLYRIVRRPKGQIFTYDWLPPAFYRCKAKLLGRSLDEVFVSELQAEPWFNKSAVLDTPIEEQNQTMNAERLRLHMDYVERIGVPRAYLWGVEWWYWMKQEKGQNEYWDIAKGALGR